MSASVDAPGDSADAIQHKYTAIAQWFHWAIAAMIVLQFVLAQLSEWAEHDGERLRQLALLANHKSVGMTILVLAIARLAWRLTHTPPKLPVAMVDWQKSASHWAHVALYGFLFALPVTGWLMSSAAAYSVSWFNVFSWPDLIAPSVAWRDNLKLIHEWLGKALFVTALIHIGAACKHHFIDRDTVLKRMTTTATFSAFIALVGLGAFSLTNVGAKAPAPQHSESSDEIVQSASDSTTAAVSVRATSESAPATAAAAAPPLWIIDADNSTIEFTAEQAGASFTGVWQRWQGELRFDADNLALSAFDVSIDVTGVETDDADRNATLQDAEWFDAASFPVARFSTQEITVDGDGFSGQCTLTIKDKASPVTFLFTVKQDGNTVMLNGTARLDRLALGVGTGEWASTEWVGQYVDVAVVVTAELP
ncbi:MAG: cytochrome b/b6 domain-containing protein [Pseudomonadota bacterium]